MIFSDFLLMISSIFQNIPLSYSMNKMGKAKPAYELQ